MRVLGVVPNHPDDQVGAGAIIAKPFQGYWKGVLVDLSQGGIGGQRNVLSTGAAEAACQSESAKDPAPAKGAGKRGNKLEKVSIMSCDTHVCTRSTW